MTNDARPAAKLHINAIILPLQPFFLFLPRLVVTQLLMMMITKKSTILSLFRKFMLSRKLLEKNEDDEDDRNSQWSVLGTWIELCNIDVQCLALSRSSLGIRPPAVLQS